MRQLPASAPHLDYQTAKICTPCKELLSRSGQVYRPPTFRVSRGLRHCAVTMTASLFWCVGHGVCIKVRQTGRQVNRFLDKGQYISVSYQGAGAVGAGYHLLHGIRDDVDARWAAFLAGGVGPLKRGTDVVRVGYILGVAACSVALLWGARRSWVRSP